jgi:small subunit ribosomal protein S6
LAVIVDGELDEPVAQAKVKSISDQITAAGGTVVGSPLWWGKRRFQYEIAKKWEGYYFFLNVVAPGAALDEVERGLRLADDIVRHKLLRLPDREAARRSMVGVAD